MVYNYNLSEVGEYINVDRLQQWNLKIRIYKKNFTLFLRLFLGRKRATSENGVHQKS